MENSLQSYNKSSRIVIYYSSTTGTSCKYAYLLDQYLSEKFTHVDIEIMSLAEWEKEQFLEDNSLVIMLLSTYGSGECPFDGIQFRNWILSLEKTKKILENRKFIIFGLGSSAFPTFADFSQNVFDSIEKIGGKHLLPLQKSDSNSQNKNIAKMFPGWRQKVVEQIQKSQLNDETLDETHEEFLSNGIQGTFKIHRPRPIAKNELTLYDQDGNEFNMKLRKEYTRYKNAIKTTVVQIKELQNTVGSSDRSTLLIRMKKPQNFHLKSADNIFIFAENLNLKPKCMDRSPNQSNESTPTKDSPFGSPDSKNSSDQKSLKRQGISKLIDPETSISLNQLKKLINFKVPVTKKHIISALKGARPTNPEQSIPKFKAMLQDDNKPENLTIQDLINELNPNLSFYSHLLWNAPRVYTVSSYSEEYIDLCVSIVKNGLASEYFKSLPSEIRIESSNSSFQIKEKDKSPIIMIANGSGIAPFRSICQYISTLPQNDRPKLQLYFGIKNKQVDFYFEEEWKVLSEKNILTVQVAESQNPKILKTHVQDILKDHLNELKDHLIKKNGKIFICGKKEMIKDVQNLIFESLKLHYTDSPFVAYRQLKRLIYQKMIISQSFS